MRTEIGWGDDIVVDDGEGVNACQDEVLCDFVGKCFHGDEEDVGVADFFLCLDSPESYLSVVEGDLIYASVSVTCGFYVSGCSYFPALIPAGVDSGCMVVVSTGTRTISCCDGRSGIVSIVFAMVAVIV